MKKQFLAIALLVGVTNSYAMQESQPTKTPKTVKPDWRTNKPLNYVAYAAGFASVYFGLHKFASPYISKLHIAVKAPLGAAATGLLAHSVYEMRTQPLHVAKSCLWGAEAAAAATLAPDVTNWLSKNAVAVAPKALTKAPVIAGLVGALGAATPVATAHTGVCIAKVINAKRKP